MTFAAPGWLWAFAVFPLLIALVFASERRRAELIAKIVAARLQPRLAGSVSVAKRRARFLCALLGLAGAILALARPQWGFTWEEAKRKGRDVIIAIDTSRSMLADDIKPNRLTRAKLAAQDLIEELGGDRVGVVAFAGTAFLQSPLTIDYAAALNALKEIDTEIIPQGGTNLEGALRSAREAFGKGESENRALVIFSDGEELDADAKKAVEELKGQVRVFTVGVGTPQGALIPIRTRGRLEYVNDEAGNVVRSKLDESRLREVAEATGGFYLPLQTGRAEMQRIVRDGLGKMTEQDIDARLSRRPIERFQWPLGAGLLALAMSMLLGERRRVSAALAMLMLPMMASAKNDGVEAYERQDFERAHREFSEQLKRRPNLPELEFDLGAAAYKRGDYEAALGSFGRAMTSEDAGLRGKAAYNLGNTLFQRGAAQQEKEAKLAEWREAIAKYEQALANEPKNEDASYNRDVVRKLIEELEKEPPKQDEQKQEDKKDEEKKDDKEQQKQDQQQQQKDQQQNKDDQQQPQQGSQQQDQQKDSQGQEQKDAGKESQPKDQQGEQGQQQQQQGNKPEPMPEQPGEKKEGELKSAPQAGESQEQRDAAEAQAEAQAAAEGRMTPQQARALLDSMKSEDEKVRLADPREKQGMRRVLKDW